MTLRLVYLATEGPQVQDHIRIQYGLRVSHSQLPGSITQMQKRNVTLGRGVLQGITIQRKVEQPYFNNRIDTNMYLNNMWSINADVRNLIPYYYADMATCFL